MPTRPVAGQPAAAQRPPPSLSRADAERCAGWFAVLADPTRVRLLHALSSSPDGARRIVDLAADLGTSESTCSHHVDLLEQVGLLVVDEVGGSCRVSIDAAGRSGLPHPADAVLGTLASRPGSLEDLPPDVTTRAVTDADMVGVLGIYEEGLATRNATFETRLPTAEHLRTRWVPGMAWVAELDGEVVGWTAVTPVSGRECYAGVGETSVYVAGSARGRGVGKALLHTQVTEADRGGMWTLQTSIFPENRASLALHLWAGYRTLAVRARIAQLDGIWRDTVMLERRSETS